MFFKKRSPDVHTMIMAQINDVENCLLSFESFMTAALTAGEPDRQVLKALCEKLDQAEDVADASLRAMIDSLKQTPYLPATQEALISIATSCDKVANKCEAVARLIVLRRIPCPNTYVDDINKIIAITKEQFQKLQKCISMLFSQMNVLASDPTYLGEIRAMETQVDKIEDAIYEDLFAGDRELAEKVEIARVVEELCDLSDIIEDIADKIQIMLIVRKA